MTPISRRNFLHSTAAASAAALAPIPPQSQTLPAFSSLKPLGDRIRPLTADEFHARLLHAQSLMAQANPAFEAILIGPGTSLYYFTGIRWWLSERLLALVIPRSGQPILISPAFEEARMRESLLYSAEVRAWQEDESPSQLIATSLAGRGLRTGRIGIEERLSFTFFDHIR